jgi:hypothetical protein
MTCTPLPTAALQLRCALSVGRHDVAAVSAVFWDPLPVGAFLAWRLRRCNGAQRCRQFRYPDYLYQTQTTAGGDPVSLWHAGRCYVPRSTKCADEQGVQEWRGSTGTSAGQAEAWKTGATRMLHDHQHHERRLRRRRLLSAFDSFGPARLRAGTPQIHVKDPLADMFHPTIRGLAAGAQRLTGQREHGSTLSGRPMLHGLI